MIGYTASPEATASEPPPELGNPELAALGFVDATAAPFSADPTARTDATEALQKAINFARDHQMVCFFPPGEYRVSDTLTCEQFRPMRGPGRRKGTRDFHCVLVGSRRGEKRPRIVLADRCAGYGDPEKPKYVIRFWSPGIGTEAAIDEPQPNISMNQMLIGIDIAVGQGNPGAVAIRHRGAQGSGVEDCTIDARGGLTGLEGGCGSGGIHTHNNSTAASCLNWRAGRRSIFRDVNTHYSFWTRQPQGPARSMPPEQREGLYNHPVVSIEGHGGGRWYNFHQESSRGHGTDYRHLLVADTTEPLSMYQCNPEHARSDANMELRGARNVSIYGVKGEYYQPILWIRDCDHIRVFGYGGNAAAHPGRSLFVVERTPNFLLANLVDSPRLPQGIPDTFFAGDGVDPNRWHMLLERPVTGPEILTPPLERPVLYRRGEPDRK